MLKGTLSTEQKQPLGIYLFRFIWLIYVCIHKHWGMNAWRYFHLCAMRLWHWPHFLKRTTMDVQRTITLGTSSTLNPQVYWYWRKTNLCKLPSLMVSHYFWLRAESKLPQGKDLGLPQKKARAPLRTLDSCRGPAKWITPKRHIIRACERYNNNNTAGLFCSAHFDPRQMEWGGEGERGRWSFCIQQEKEMFKTLIHLGFRTTLSNYSLGNPVKAVVFQGWRETTFCCNYALLYMNHIPCVVWQPLKTERMPFLRQKPWASVPRL